MPSSSSTRDRRGRPRPLPDRVAVVSGPADLGIVPQYDGRPAGVRALFSQG